MNSIKCGQCGFINWATAPSCKRCRHSFGPDESASGPDGEPDGPAPVELEDSLGHDAPPMANICSFCRTPGTGSHCPLCRKPFFEAPPRAGRAERASLLPSLASQKKLAAALAVLLVAVAAAFAYKSGLLIKRDPKAELAEQIEAAVQFKEPVYLHLPTRGKQTPPGGEVLRERGFITLRTGTSMASFWSAPTTNVRTQLWGLGESQSSSGGGDSVLVGLTETGINASGKWQQQTMGDSTQVWLVPVGGRELVEVKEVKKPQTPTGEDYLRMPPAMREYFPSSKDQPALVASFTWRWSPNDLGLYFDINSGEFKSLPLKAQQNARACIYSDSKALRTGMAAFKKEGEKLVLQYVHFDDTPLAAPAGTP